MDLDAPILYLANDSLIVISIEAYELRQSHMIYTLHHRIILRLNHN